MHELRLQNKEFRLNLNCDLHLLTVYTNFKERKQGKKMWKLT